MVVNIPDGERTIFMNNIKFSKEKVQRFYIFTANIILTTYNPVNNDDLDGQHIGVDTYPCRNSTPWSLKTFNVSGMYSMLPEMIIKFNTIISINSTQ